MLPEPPPLPQPVPPPLPAPPRRVARSPVARPAPQESPAPEPSPAPPAAPAAAEPSNAVPSWRSELINRLQRAKRYPETARGRGEQGVATVTFAMDRSGRVLSAGVVRSSGSPSLDEEAVALIRRAEPLPPVPAEVAGNAVTLTIPVAFSLR